MSGHSILKFQIWLKIIHIYCKIKNSWLLSGKTRELPCRTMRLLKTNVQWNIRKSYEKMWLLLPPPLQTQDLMGYPFFNLSISRSLLYFNCLQKSGTNWIGLHFHFLPISCGSRVYQIPMVWNENEEDDLWIDISRFLGLHPPFVHGFPSYD